DQMVLFGIWCLVIGAYLVIGAWDLEFHLLPPDPLRRMHRPAPSEERAWSPNGVNIYPERWVKMA
ncbi:MAG: hypothetical protein JXA24_08220, partial [Proteobacteria bacterium]|nr:hypothetical protein [Pseudomonadota bacterium]